MQQFLDQLQSVLELDYEDADTKRLAMGPVLAEPLGAPYLRFPVELGGSPELYAPFLKERRTRSLVDGCVQEIRGISLVFREMWIHGASSASLYRP
jgi:hypothetical protein